GDRGRDRAGRCTPCRRARSPGRARQRSPACHLRPRHDDRARPRGAAVVLRLDGGGRSLLAGPGPAGRVPGAAGCSVNQTTQPGQRQSWKLFLDGSLDCLTLPRFDGGIGTPIAPPALGPVPRGTGTMAKPLLSDELWAAIEPLLPVLSPSPKGGHSRLADRKALTGILFVLKTGIPWEDLPCEMGCGCGMNCWRRLRDWQADGTWGRI